MNDPLGASSIFTQHSEQAHIQKSRQCHLIITYISIKLGQTSTESTNPHPPLAFLTDFQLIQFLNLKYPARMKYKSANKTHQTDLVWCRISCC